mgnify:CR=1 FL=1
MEDIGNESGPSRLGRYCCIEVRTSSAVAGEGRWREARGVGVPERLSSPSISSSMVGIGGGGMLNDVARVAGPFAGFDFDFPFFAASSSFSDADESVPRLGSRWLRRARGRTAELRRGGLCSALETSSALDRKSVV